MEIRIGVIYTARELVVDVEETPEQVTKAIEDAIGGDSNMHRCPSRASESTSTPLQFPLRWVAQPACLVRPITNRSGLRCPNSCSEKPQGNGPYGQRARVLTWTFTDKGGTRCFFGPRDRAA